MPYANINGISMYYESEGTGTPIVFIHPPLLTSKNFAYQKELSRSFQMITFDIRGHGHSGFSATPLIYPVIVDDIVQLLDLLQIEKCYLCGYSTGGSIALAAMLTYPERFSGSIQVSSMSEASDWWIRTRLTAAIAISGWNRKKFLSLAITSGNSDSLSTFIHLYRDAKKGNVRNMEQYYRYSKRYNCTARLNTIQTPQLLIFGEKDKGFYRYAKILEKELPNNELYFIKDKHHQLPTKAPEKLNQLISQWIIKQEQLEPHKPIRHKEWIADEWMTPPNPTEEHFLH